MGRWVNARHDVAVSRAQRAAARLTADAKASTACDPVFINTCFGSVGERPARSAEKQGGLCRFDATPEEVFC